MKRMVAVLVAAVAAFGVATAGAQDKKTRLPTATFPHGGRC
jgi:hypothetical protein